MSISIHFPAYGNNGRGNKKISLKKFIQFLKITEFWNNSEIHWASWMINHWHLIPICPLIISLRPNLITHEFPCFVFTLASPLIHTRGCLTPFKTKLDFEILKNIYILCIHPNWMLLTFSIVTTSVAQVGEVGVL